MRNLALFVFAFFLVVVPAAAEDLWKTVPEPAALPRADESGLAAVNGIKIYYEVYNKSGGDPVLLLHGGLGSTLNWGNQVPELMKSHEVIAIDSRGHGRSTRSDAPYSYELMASDTLGLLDALKVDKVSLVGWSDGGIIGLVIAMQHPERLNRLFTYGANYNLSGVKETVMNDPVFSQAIGMQMTNYQKLSPTPKDFDNFMQAISGMWFSQPDFKPEQLAKIKIPVTIADGQYDEAIKPEHTAELAEFIPGARLVIIPNVSHMGMWQNPAAFNRAVAEFLEKK
ncbi:MAG: alpha/beta hydrolase [Rhizobiales bacterium]|nr:alpha/beta hydrolase [Hyphomicrobiales bacterium]